MGLSLERVSHAYGEYEVFSDVSFSVADGEIVCLLGPSGCGKTTLLRLAAGLEKLQTGRVTLSDGVAADQETHVPPELREVGLMFQDFALFPHLSVSDNVAFGLNTLPDVEKRQRVINILMQVNMFEKRADYPHQLSGGQQQRVALARALAPNPAVMLLDEPFSGLDQNLRISLREETLGILKTSNVATLLVTHDPEEAMFMADRILVMGPGGAILQEGTPDEIYGSPTHSFVASLFGWGAQFEGVAQGGEVETPLGKVPAPNCADGRRVDVVIRPHGIKLTKNENEGVPVDVLSVRPLGRNTFIRFRALGQNPALPDLRCRKKGTFEFGPDDVVRAMLHPNRVFTFHQEDKPNRAGRSRPQIMQKKSDAAWSALLHQPRTG